MAKLRPRFSVVPENRDKPVEDPTRKAWMYELQFSDGKKYLGVTTSPIRKRINAHRQKAKNGRNFLVAQAWRALGEPEVRVLQSGTLEELKALETQKLPLYLWPSGYNEVPYFRGGAPVPRRPTLGNQKPVQSIRPLGWRKGNYPHNIPERKHEQQ